MITEAQRKKRFFSLMERYVKLGEMLKRSIDADDSSLENGKSILAEIHRTRALMEEIMEIERIRQGRPPTAA